MKNGTVILLGIGTPIGLSIIRELGRKGVRVIGLGSKEDSLGRYSRYIYGTYVRQRGEELIAQINKLATLYDATALMAISESDMQLLNRHRNQLESIKILIPEADLLNQALDKEVTYRLASQVGINVPKTTSISSVAEFESMRFLDEIDFPVVLKWPDPQSVLIELRSKNLEFIKSEYAYSREELLGKLNRYIDLGKFPIIQTFCAGQGLGQFFLVKNGEVIQKFQHLRVHEWPPEGGFSTLCSAVPLSEHAALMKKSEQLLLSMGWEGVAMVEYRYSPVTRQSYLMEVNGRFWGSLPLAYHCNAQFAWLLYQAFGLDRTPSILPPRDDLHCRYIIPETKRLIRVVANSGGIPDRSFKPTPVRDLCSYLLDFFNPRMRYFLFSWRDPLPFFADLRSVVFKAIRSLS